MLQDQLLDIRNLRADYVAGLDPTSVIYEDYRRILDPAFDADVLVVCGFLGNDAIDDALPQRTVYAGLMHSYSSNALNRWKEGGELEVELPRSLTDGKSRFTVEVRPVAGTAPLRIGQVTVHGYLRD